MDLNKLVLKWAQNFPEGTDIAADRKRKEEAVLRWGFYIVFGSGLILLNLAVWSI